MVGASENEATPGTAAINPSSSRATQPHRPSQLRARTEKQPPGLRDEGLRGNQADLGVGSRLIVYWDGDAAWYAGVVSKASVRAGRKQHFLRYDDGDERWEDLSKIPWLPLGAHPSRAPAAQAQDPPPSWPSAPRVGMSVWMPNATADFASAPGGVEQRCSSGLPFEAQHQNQARLAALLNGDAASDCLVTFECGTPGASSSLAQPSSLAPTRGADRAAPDARKRPRSWFGPMEGARPSAAAGASCNIHAPRATVLRAQAPCMCRAPLPALYHEGAHPTRTEGWADQGGHVRAACRAKAHSPHLFPTTRRPFGARRACMRCVRVPDTDEAFKARHDSSRSTPLPGSLTGAHLGWAALPVSSRAMAAYGMSAAATPPAVPALPTLSSEVNSHPHAAAIPPATPQPSAPTYARGVTDGAERTCLLPPSAPHRTLSAHQPLGSPAWPWRSCALPANPLVSPRTPFTDVTDRTDTTSASSSGGPAACSPTSPVDGLGDLEGMLGEGTLGEGMLGEGLLSEGLLSGGGLDSDRSVDVWQQLLSQLADPPAHAADSETGDGVMGHPPLEGGDECWQYQGAEGAEDGRWGSGTGLPVDDFDAHDWVRRSSRNTAGAGPHRLGQDDGWGVGAAREWQTDGGSPVDPCSPWPFDDAALPFEESACCDAAASDDAPTPHNEGVSERVGGDLAGWVLDEVTIEMARRVEEARQAADPSVRFVKCAKCGGRKRAPASRCGGPCPSPPPEVDPASVEAGVLAAQAEEADQSAHAAHEHVSRAAVALAGARADLDKALARVHAIRHLADQGAAAGRLC